MLARCLLAPLNASAYQIERQLRHVEPCYCAYEPEVAEHALTSLHGAGRGGTAHRVAAAHADGRPQGAVARHRHGRYKSPQHVGSATVLQIWIACARMLSAS